MSAYHVTELAERTLRDANISAKSGLKMIQCDPTELLADSSTIRAAANQLRQAAKELDNLDGILNAQSWMARK